MDAPTRMSAAIREKVSAVLFCSLLAVVAVASISSLRWVSPAAHTDSSFDGGFDLTCATILGLAILVIAALSYLVSPSSKPFSKLILMLIAESLLALGLIVSTAYAGDKRIAINCAAGLAVGVILMHATCRLTDRPWKLRLAVITLIAIGAVFSTKVWLKELYEIDQTRETYMQTRYEFWAGQGKALDDPAVKLFEARLASRDNGGFFFHGNLGGAFLATVFVASLAGIWYRLGDPTGQFRTLWLILQVMLSGFVASALIITYSKGAILAGVVGVAIGIVLLIFSQRFARHVKKTIVVSALIVAAGLAIPICYGLVKRTLPTLSLAYRWQYWTASYSMFEDHPLTGVGAGNFGYHYLRYKLPEAEEEISSPHNFIVQGLTELGLFGGVGLLLLVVAIFYWLARSAATVSGKPHDRGPPGPSALVYMFWIGLAIFGVAFVFTQVNRLEPIHFIAEYLPYTLVFGLVFIVGSFRNDKLDHIDNAPGPGGKLAQRGVLIWLACAAVTFVAGNLVNFSLFEPSTQFLFFFLAGLSMGSAGSPRSSVGMRMNILKSVVLTAATVGYLLYVLIPSAKIETLVADAKLPVVRHTDPLSDPIYRELVQLSREHKYDAHASAQAAGRLLALSQTGSRRVLESAAEHYADAVRRADPIARFWRGQGHCYVLLATVDPANRDKFLTKTDTLFDQARARVPLAKSAWLGTAVVGWAHAKDLPPSELERKRSLARKASEYLQTALRLNDAIPKASLYRFSDRQLTQIRGTLSEIDKFLPKP